MIKALKSALVPSLLWIAVCLLCSCKPPGEKSSSEETVSWPELAHFDELSYRAEGMARVGDFEELKAVYPELLKAGQAVNKESMPANSKKPQEVEQLLTDLMSLVEGLSQEDLEDDTMKQLVLGLHPIIADMIKAAGMPHLHGNEGPNSGFLHPVFDGGGEQTGTVEVKLHSDAGDVEIWLTKGGREGAPWRLPLDTVLKLEFPTLGKSIDLAVRNTEKNENEAGESTIVDGATAYFIFPGESGVDPSWLIGEEFAAKAELSFEDATTGVFVLRPHIH